MDCYTKTRGHKRRGCTLGLEDGKISGLTANAVAALDWRNHRKGTKAIRGNNYRSPGQREKSVQEMLKQGGNSWLKMLRVSVLCGNAHGAEQQESAGRHLARMGTKGRMGLDLLLLPSLSLSSLSVSYTHSSIFRRPFPRTVTIAHPFPRGSEKCLPVMDEWRAVG